MNARFLVNTVSSDPLIRSDQACRDLVDEAKDYLLLPQDRLNKQGPRTRRRKPIKSSEMLFAGLLIVFFSKKNNFVFFNKTSWWLVFR
jgi:kelch-like protein 20